MRIGSFVLECIEIYSSQMCGPIFVLGHYYESISKYIAF